MVIIGIPAYNEEGTIADIVTRAKQYADMVIVIDDGSTDKTAELAIQAGAAVLKHIDNLGYGETIRHIITVANYFKVDCLIILDADGQHDPGEIPKLLNAINTGYDVVIGTRNLHSHSIPLMRRYAIMLLAIMVSIASRRRYKDTESGFRAYSNKALNALHLTQSGMSISAEIAIEAARRGLKVAEVPISVSYEDNTPSQNPIMQGIGNAWFILKRIFT